jgi:hypothetical protein
MLDEFGAVFRSAGTERVCMSCLGRGRCEKRQDTERMRDNVRLTNNNLIVI